MMKFPFYLLLAICSMNCSQPSATETGNADSTESNLSASISDLREKVKSEPVASFRKKLDNDLNDWYFSVRLFETTKRFEFKVQMQYEEITGEDVISFPNLGFEPKPELRPGKSTYSCIIGFLDDEGVFREYKEVSFQNEQLKMTTLKRYAVTPVE